MIVHVDKNSSPARTGGAGGGGRRKTSPAVVPTEHAEQVRLLRFIRESELHGYCKVRGLLVFGIPNAGRRSFQTAASFQAEGMMSGVADLCVIGGGDTAFLEMKRAKGGVVSDAQRQFQSRLTDAGAVYGLARGFDEAVALLVTWGFLWRKEAARG